MHKAKKINFDLAVVLHRTYMNQEHVKHCSKIVNDEDKDKRLEKQECVICFHSGHVGGASVTETNCAVCDERMIFSNTCVDVLCIKCAQKYKVCKHCGADINLENRRKL